MNTRGAIKLAGLLATAVLFAGCDSDPYAGVRYSDSPVKLKDDVAANVALDQGLEDSLAGLEFTAENGEKVDLAKYRGKKNVVLVVTRGYGAGGYGANICMYCATQTSRLIDSYEEFAKRDAEVVVVYPIDGDDPLGKYAGIRRQTYQPLEREPEPTPFPLLLDIDLVAVDKLGIRKDLSKPATYILDKQGRVSFAYVGETLSDRPSLVVMLEELDRLQATEAGAAKSEPSSKSQPE